MATLDYRNHARAKPIQALVYKVFSRSEPALEGFTHGWARADLRRERECIRQRGVHSLIRSAGERLNQRQGGKDKWRYTKRHCAEVGFLSLLIASEAKKHGIEEADGMDPNLCFVGGILHDIGKTFLPMPLMVKELGVEILFWKMFEGAKMTEMERQVLRYHHLVAGTDYVRLFGGNGEIETILDMVGLHHVMYNGEDSVVPSYPTLKKGKKLPFHARIAKTADFLSAVLPRHYRENSWVLSLRTSMAYAMAVAGLELDPKTVACAITGTHDIGFREAEETVRAFMHPKGQSGISDSQLMQSYVCGDEKREEPGGIVNDERFVALGKRFDSTKMLGYEIDAEMLSIENGFPTLGDVSPMSIKNKYALGLS